MKKALLLFTILCLVGTVSAAEDNLYEMFKDSKVIKIFLNDAVNEAKSPEVKIDIYKPIFKDIAGKRIEMKFTVVDDKANADVIISCRIKDYVFVGQALPMMFSAATVAVDTISPKSSGKIVADYEVKRASDGKVILAYKNFTTEERRPIKDMEGEFGYTKSLSKNITRFIYRAFYKPRALIKR